MTSSSYGRFVPLSNSLLQLDGPSSAVRRRATTTSGHWVSEDTDTGAADHRSPEPFAVEPSAPTVGLWQAAALLGAATRLHASSDPQTLLPAIAAEAHTLLPGDGAIIVSRQPTGWIPVSGPDSTAVPELVSKRCSQLVMAGLLEPGHIADLDFHLPLSQAQLVEDELPVGRWRSLVVADLDGARTLGRPQTMSSHQTASSRQAASSPRSGAATRLLWYATTAHAFTGWSDLASLFAGHAVLALHAATTRHHLELAIDSRTITGQASES